MAWLRSANKNEAFRGLGASAADAAQDRPTVLSMYLKPMPGDVAIEEFERFAIDRLRGDQEWFLDLLVLDLMQDQRKDPPITFMWPIMQY
jgi:hypothetical protein